MTPELPKVTTEEVVRFRLKQLQVDLDREMVGMEGEWLTAKASPTSSNLQRLYRGSECVLRIRLAMDELKRLLP